MTNSNNNGIELPAAPLVWEAVQFATYAQSRMETYKGELTAGEIDYMTFKFGGLEQMFTYEMTEWMKEWVVGHARRDRLYLLDFTDQLSGVYETISDTAYTLDCTSEDFLCDNTLTWLGWHLVLRGESAVREALECPDIMFSIFGENLLAHTADIVYQAAERIFEKPPQYRWDIAWAISGVIWKSAKEIADYFKGGKVPSFWSDYLLHPDLLTFGPRGVEQREVFAPAIEVLRQYRSGGRADMDA